MLEFNALAYTNNDIPTTQSRKDLNISGYALKLNARNVIRGLSFSLTSFLKVETSVVCTALRSLARIVRSCSLKPWIELFLTGYTKRKKSCKKLTDSVRNEALCDSPIESFRGWSLLGLIARYQVLLISTEPEVYRRQVVRCA